MAKLCKMDKRTKSSEKHNVENDIIRHFRQKFNTSRSVKRWPHNLCESVSEFATSRAKNNLHKAGQTHDHIRQNVLLEMTAKLRKEEKERRIQMETEAARVADMKRKMTSKKKQNRKFWDKVKLARKMKKAGNSELLNTPSEGQKSPPELQGCTLISNK